MAYSLHNILKANCELLNLNGANLESEFNQYTVILYYVDPIINDTESLGMHSDRTFFPKDIFVAKLHNSQVENTPAVIYSLGVRGELY